MGYTADSVRYLDIAYALFLLVQLGYVAWLIHRWRQVSSAATPAKPDSRLTGS